MAATARHIQKHITSQSTEHMQRITPHMPITYVRMVFRQQATSELQHAFLQRNRFGMPSKFTVRQSKIAYGRTCTAFSKNTSPHNQQSTYSA
jgi:hypothetical protein